MPDDPSAIMLFAAGFGTRMGALTQTRPKPLVEVAGRALIDHALDIARPLHLPIVVNTHYRGEMIEAHLADQLGITLNHEHPDILETGGGLKHALPLMPQGAVMTLNTDAIWAGSNPLKLLRESWDSTEMEALLLLIDQDSCVGRTGGGDFAIAPNGSLNRDKTGLVYTGAHITKTERVAQTEGASFSLNQVWDEMISDGTLFAIRYPGRWGDVGTPDGILTAEEMLRDV